MPNAVFIIREQDRDNLELVRQIILYRLKHDSEWQQLGHWYEQSQRVVKFEDQAFVSAFSLMADEIMWQLIAQGVITPGQDTSNPTLPFFRVTAYGRSVLEAERMIPPIPLRLWPEPRCGHAKGLGRTGTETQPPSPVGRTAPRWTHPTPATGDP